MSVHDLTNKWHGVFLNEEDAKAYFEEKKKAYATDPQLIEEAKNAKFDLKSALELVDPDEFRYDSYY